jgi:uncharacterized membrane protein YbhN (UPF0104 family)
MAAAMDQDEDGTSGFTKVHALWHRIARHGAWRRLLGVAAVCLGAFLVFHVLRRYSLGEITDSVGHIPFWRLGMAGLFAAASYVCLTFFDFLAVQYAGRKISYPYAAMTSFMALSIGHNVGMAALSSGAIRYRYYARRGLRFADIAKVIVFCALTVGLGLVLLGGLALCAAPGLAAEIAGISQSTALAVGIACLAVAAGYLPLCGTLRRELRLWRWRVHLPPLRLALAQSVIGPINFAMVAGCLYHALASLADVAYLQVAAAYVIANAAALLSHVPGGLGVIEAVIQALVTSGSVIGGLIVFRVVYFLAPGVVGGVALLITELVIARRRGARPTAASR